MSLNYSDSDPEVHYTINEAAAACGVSRDTIKRRLARGGLPGARRVSGPGPRGPWVIPESGLVAAGLLEGVTQASSSMEELKIRLAVTEAQLAEVRWHVNELRALVCREACRLRPPLQS